MENLQSLEPNQIRDIIKNPRNKKNIGKAILESSRLKLHTEADVEIDKESQAYRMLIAYFDCFIEDNGARERLHQYLANAPLPSVETMEKVWTKANRIWEADDTYRQVVMSTPDLIKEANEYLDEENIQGFMKEYTYNEYKIDPNAFVIIDINKQLSSASQDVEDADSEIDIEDIETFPYPFIVSSLNLLDYQMVNNQAYYVFFKSEDPVKQKKIAVLIDSNAYYTYEYQEEEINIKTQQIYEHKLGYVPAFQLSLMPMKTLDYNLKKNIVTNSLSTIDWFLLKKIQARYLDILSFGAIEMPEDKCSYKDCDNGKIFKQHQITNEIYSVDCPKCEGGKTKGLLGAGLVIEKPPITKDQGDVGGINYKHFPEGFLRYHESNIENYEENLIYNIIGALKEPSNNQAKNEKQIESSFESRKDVLMQLSYNFQVLEDNIVSTMLKLKYGEEFVDYIVHYGHQYYLTKPKDILEEIKLLDDANLSEFQRMDRIKEFNDARYKNDLNKKDRNNILSNLEPFPTISATKAKELGLDIEYPIDYIIKVYFSDFIQRFERENQQITKLGEAKTFQEKINLIKEQLETYANEQREKNQRLNGGRDISNSRFSDNEEIAEENFSQQES